MRVMVFVKATEDSEAGVMPTTELFEAMDRLDGWDYPRTIDKVLVASDTSRLGMLVLAAVLAINVAIWTLPGPGRPPARS